MLVERGKVYKAVLVTVMRELAVLANLPVEEDRERDVDAPRRTVRIPRRPVDEMEAAWGERGGKVLSRA